MNNTIKSMPKSELAELYFPYTREPVRTFMRWVHSTPTLMRELKNSNYRKTQKNFLAIHVQIIRKHLGDPEIMPENYKSISNEIH